MGISKNKKLIKDLKHRITEIEDYWEILKYTIPKEQWGITLEFKNELKALMESYEKQIELNKKQNIKIKNQRGILKVLQQKQGGGK